VRPLRAVFWIDKAEVERLRQHRVVAGMSGTGGLGVFMWNEVSAWGRKHKYGKYRVTIEEAGS